MQVRATVMPTVTRPAMRVVAQPAAAAPGRVPAAQAQPVKPKLADKNFGSDIFQSVVYATMNIGRIVPLPAFLAGMVNRIPVQFMGLFNMGMAAFNGFKDIRGLSKDGNTKKSDDYIRLGGGAAMLLGGAALAFGAAVAPVVPLIGAGVAAVGYLARAVGVWNDETRI